MANKFLLQALTAAAIAAALPIAAQADRGDLKHEHVLLISIDGMHAADYQYCTSHGTCPMLARLGVHGVNYTRTSTSRPSDSFPGLMALMTGGTPRTFGASTTFPTIGCLPRRRSPPGTASPRGAARRACPTARPPNMTRAST